MEETNQAVAEFHGDSRIAHAGRASNGTSSIARGFRESLLHLEARRAGFASSRHDRAEGVLLSLAVMRELPRLHRAKAERESRCVAERALVFAVDFGFRQPL